MRPNGRRGIPVSVSTINTTKSCIGSLGLSCPLLEQAPAGKSNLLVADALHGGRGNRDTRPRLDCILRIRLHREQLDSGRVERWYFWRFPQLPGTTSFRSIWQEAGFYADSSRSTLIDADRPERTTMHLIFQAWRCGVARRAKLPVGCLEMVEALHASYNALTDFNSTRTASSTTRSTKYSATTVLSYVTVAPHGCATASPAVHSLCASAFPQAFSKNPPRAYRVR
jgi:hypothetical protein